MNQAALDYLQSRRTGYEFTTAGEITTECTVTLDNGTVVKGTSVRDVSNFDKTESEKAAYEDAVKTFYPGVNLILTKQ